MKDADALLREFVDLAAATSHTDHYLAQLARTDAATDALAALLKRFELKIQCLEALHAPSTRDIAKEILAITRANGKGRNHDAGPLTGWSKLDAHGQSVSLSSETWDAVLDRGHRLMWTVNSAQAGDEPHPCRQARWRTASEALSELNYQAWCGHRDWRLPSIDELLTLTYTEDGSSEYRISGTLFPDLRGDGVYWSSTRFEQTRLLQVHAFSDAPDDPRQAGVYAYVRFVRTVRDDEL